MDLLKQPEHRRDPIVLPAIIDDDDTSFQKIRCPLCEWRPSASSTWCCYNDDTPEPPFPWCGTHWNTFSTAGRCPGCQHQWKWTSCLRCNGWSLHDDWYECG